MMPYLRLNIQKIFSSFPVALSSFEVTIYQGYPRLRREGFYLVCVHSVRADARTECTQTKYYFLGQ